MRKIVLFEIIFVIGLAIIIFVKLNPAILDRFHFREGTALLQSNTITVQKIPSYIKDFSQTEAGDMVISEVFIPVDEVMQLPELPHGCEITAVTSILNYYGFVVSKTVLADEYLPKQPFSVKNGRRYGPNPYSAYAGNPRENTGFFVYAPPVVEAVETFLLEKKADFTVKDISGSTQSEIMDYLKAGTPVVVWVTKDLSLPKMNYSWYFYHNDEYFQAPTNSHTVVLNGFHDKNIYAMDPLKGHVTYESKLFFQSYQALGSHAVVIKKK
ncbi:C39 family peptidase [Bacillus kwashiorkori]|uniref:C39 family peptidase n=1 Tax=Bacillus kwashiorkori TaxID=1522318 RepID=UPI0007842519|nr:C39 family peptidase [Bacillus kwashiorkori]